MKKKNVYVHIYKYMCVTEYVTCMCNRYIVYMHAYSSRGWHTDGIVQGMPYREMEVLF